MLLIKRGIHSVIPSVLKNFNEYNVIYVIILKKGWNIKIKI